MFTILVFENKRQIVIRGVLEELEEKTDYQSNKAALISKALKEIFDEYWSIIVYDNCAEHKGYGTYFSYNNKLQIFGVSTSNINYDGNQIIQFMNEEFGWAKIADISSLQIAAEKKINAKFGRQWKVQILKTRNNSYPYYYIFGQVWQHDGYYFYILRES
jgi:hypothetical protein